LADKANDTFNWTTANEIGSADIYFANLRETLIVTYAMCDSLVYRDPMTGIYEPLLATAWEWVDPTTMDVTLRDDVTFHDGTSFGPEDVAYTLNFVSDPANESQLQTLTGWIDNVEVTGGNSVRIHAKSPTPAVLEYMTGTMPIFPDGHYDDAPEVPGAEGTRRRDNGAVTPVCTGPYRLTEFVPGEGLTLEKNNDYFADSPKGTPQIGTMVFRTIKDPETQIAELVTGGVDWIWGVPTENVDMLSSMGGIDVVAAPTLRMSFLELDTIGRSGEDAPTSDIRVRQAIAHAIDRKAIVENLVGEGSRVLPSFCAPAQFGCDTDVKQYDYDPEKARALLADAGYEDGLSIPFWSYRDRQFAEAIIGYLREVGIDADLNFVQWGALRPALAGGEVETANLTWGSNGVLDVSASTGYYFDGGEMDYARDEDITQWLEEASVETDPEAREALYSKALNRIADEAYKVPLFLYARTYGFNSEFEYPITDDELAHFYLGSWK
jgi:peptide/nickel transport system substrate-binding protein